MDPVSLPAAVCPARSLGQPALWTICPAREAIATCACDGQTALRAVLASSTSIWLGPSPPAPRPHTQHAIAVTAALRSATPDRLLRLDDLVEPAEHFTVAGHPCVVIKGLLSDQPLAAVAQ